MNLEEQAYLDLMTNVIKNGYDKSDRTGVGTKSLFGSHLRFSLENNTLPLITTKRVFVRGVIEELLFFIRGETNTKLLEEKNVNIWKGNTSREFLDKRGLKHLSEGNMGLMYGAQWRNWGGDKDHKGIDQLQNVVDLIKNDPNSRRIMVSAYNPSQSHLGVLEPCHTFFQFYVDGNNLSLMWSQRSVDLGLGFCFNLASYSILTHLIAKLSGLKAKEVIFSGGDCHLYSNHIIPIKEQLSRKAEPFPTIFIKKDLKSLKDIEELTYEDFNIVDYKCHPSIKLEFAI